METWPNESGVVIMRDFAQEYDDFLDETYGNIQIGCCTFSPSRVLSELDPIAYRCGFSDWLDSEGLTEEYEQND